MNSINSLNDKNFTLNGIQYFRNYVSAVHGNKIELYNCYERKDVLVSLTHFSEFTVNGSSYTSAAALQTALLDVTYSRLTGGDSSIIDQNNTGRTIDAGFVGPAPNYVPVYSVVAAVAEKLNAMEIVITAKETPVIITASLLADGPNGLSVTKIYKYLFKPGKGNWGQNGTTISTRHLEEITIRNYLIDDLLGQSNAVIENLGVVADGNFIAKANASNWNFYDLGTEGGAGQKTYYFSYETDDVLYFAQFTGTPGLYGISYTNKFSANDFVSSTDSRITDIPNLEKILEQGGNKNISQLINNGNGTSPFSTEAAVNGLTVTVNQAAAEMYLKNSEGTILATVNLAFLNNEGTTFFYNETKEKLELKNDAGEVLSQVPVSAFVSNLMHSVEFNGSNQSLLEFKDATGNIVDSVAVTINNIQGLQAALNTKANANGSNATGFWPIGVNSASTATQTEQFGGAYGDFLNDGNSITHVAGYDSNQTRVKRYTLSSFKLWLSMAITDISGLVTALANMTTAIGLKADKVGTLDTKVLDVPENTDLNTYLDTGLYLKRNNTGVTLELNYPIIQAGKLEVVRFSATQVYQAYHALGNNINQLFIRTLNGSAWQPWKLLANDAEVVHRTGSIVESINGAKTFTNPITYSSSTFDITIDNITGLSIIDKITAASGWSRMFRVADLTGATMGGIGIYGSGQNAIYGYLAINANNHQGSILKFNSTGVGIGLAGTTAPTAALDVVGAAKFTGEVAVANATVSGSAVNKSQLDSGLSSAANNVATNYIPSSGASTVAGTKTFTEAPVVPAGTLAVHAVNKAQLDLKADATSVVTTSTNQGSIGGDKTWIGAHTWDSNSNSLYQFKRKIDVAAQSFAAVTAVAKTGAASQDGFGGGIAVQIESSSSNGVQTMASYRGARQGNDTSGAARVATYLNGVDTERLEVSPQGVTKPINGGTLQAPAAVLPQEVIIKSQLDSGLNTAANNVASNYIPSSGASTVNGTKTFTEAPVVPAGTLASHTVNKGQLDLKANDSEVLHKLGSITESVTGQKTFNDNLGIGGAAVNTWRLKLQGQFGISSINTLGESVWELYNNAKEIRHNYGFKLVGYSGLATGQTWFINGVDGSANFTGKVTTIPATNGNEVVIKSQLDSGLALAANNIASGYVPSSGASTISGTKTFTDAPVIPAGTMANHTVNKSQLDTKANLSGGNAFNGNQSVAGTLTAGTVQCYLYQGNVAGNHLVFSNVDTPNTIASKDKSTGTVGWNITDGRPTSNTDNIVDFVKGTTIRVSVRTNGTIKATGATNTDEVIIKSQLDSRESTVYNNIASTYVPLIGASTITGTKTFVNAPIVPIPTLAGHPVNKALFDAWTDNADQKLSNLEDGNDYAIDNTYNGSSAWFTTLNNLYPTAKKGFTVYAIGSGEKYMCKKLNDNQWIIHAGIIGIVT